jgi:zinc transporter ZupT
LRFNEQTILILVFVFITFVSTFTGGMFAIKFKSKLHLIMGFTAGIILGVICFDILPEIIEKVNEKSVTPTAAMLALVAGFLIFHILEKYILIHHSHESDYAMHHHPQVGVFSAMALIGHSFMDGVGIGLAFQVTPVTGVLVAIAVISHDFTDGINTITVMLLNKNSVQRSKLFLFFDALSPVAGAFATIFFSFSPQVLSLYLGFFAGFLLYIGVADILPEAHRSSSSFNIVALTILGVAVIFTISQII